MKLVITIDTDNEAFQRGNLLPETGRILRVVARRLWERVESEGIESLNEQPIVLLDANGNTVGECQASES